MLLPAYSAACCYEAHEPCRSLGSVAEDERATTTIETATVPPHQGRCEGTDSRENSCAACSNSVCVCVCVRGGWVWVFASRVGAGMCVAHFAASSLTPLGRAVILLLPFPFPSSPPVAGPVCGLPVRVNDDKGAK